MAKEDLEERAYRSIIRMILENRFKPEDCLLETELAVQLELSRTPVRQALGRLGAEGFLEKRRKKGCVIPMLTPEDAQQVFFARQAIEGQTAAACISFFFDAFYLQNNATRQIHFTPQQHNQIIEAIAHHNPKEARAAVKQHIQHTYDVLFTT